MPRKATSKKRVKLPATWTPAKVRVDKRGRVQVKVNPAKLGSGGRFAKCVASVEARGGAADPKAVCAAAGRKKYGVRKMAAMAKAGRKRKNPSGYVWEVYAHDPGYSQDKLFRGTVTASSKTAAAKLAKRFQRAVVGSHGMIREVITLKRGKRID